VLFGNINPNAPRQFDASLCEGLTTIGEELEAFVAMRKEEFASNL